MIEVERAISYCRLLNKGQNKKRRSVVENNTAIQDFLSGGGYISHRTSKQLKAVIFRFTKQKAVNLFVNRATLALCASSQAHFLIVAVYSIANDIGIRKHIHFALFDCFRNKQPTLFRSMLKCTHLNGANILYRILLALSKNWGQLEVKGEC